MPKKPDGILAYMVSDETFDAMIAGAADVSEVPLALVGGRAETEPEVSGTSVLLEQELTTLYAMLAYVADRQSVRQDLVQAVVEARFGVSRLAALGRQDYSSAVEFLSGLRMDTIRN